MCYSAPVSDTTISSQNDEGCSMDDDEASSILSNLPNSCQDFERQVIVTDMAIVLTRELGVQKQPDDVISRSF